MRPPGYDSVILEHYGTQAREQGLKATSTMLDATVRERETRLVEGFVERVVRFFDREEDSEGELRLCDAGCGNGFTLSVLQEKFPSLDFLGFEFSPDLLGLAKKRFREMARVKILPGDIRTLKGHEESFQIVLCQRVLINLLDPQDQRRGLAVLTSLLKPGGFLLSIEAFEEPLLNLNSARAEFGLPALPQAHHNRYLPKEFFAEEKSLVPVLGPVLDRSLPENFLPSNFLSSHYFISRVMHPLFSKPEETFIRNSHFVRFFTEAIDQPIGDYSPIKAFAFRKAQGPTLAARRVRFRGAA